jgi:hypothetical protein
MDKLEFFNKIKLLKSEFNKNNPCKYCVGNGCDDCRDCPDAEKRFIMETNIYNLKIEYKNLYGSNYDDDYIDYLRSNRNTKISKSVTTYKKILKEWCENNMNIHSDWTGTRVETNNICSTIDEFVDKLWNYLEDKSNKMD